MIDKNWKRSGHQLIQLPLLHSDAVRRKVLYARPKIHQAAAFISS